MTTVKSRRFIDIPYKSLISVKAHGNGKFLVKSSKTPGYESGFFFKTKIFLKKKYILSELMVWLRSYTEKIVRIWICSFTKDKLLKG